MNERMGFMQCPHCVDDTDFICQEHDDAPYECGTCGFYGAFDDFLYFEAADCGCDTHETNDHD